VRPLIGQRRQRREEITGGLGFARAHPRGFVDRDLSSPDGSDGRGLVGSPGRRRRRRGTAGRRGRPRRTGLGYKPGRTDPDVGPPRGPSPTATASSNFFAGAAASSCQRVRPRPRRVSGRGADRSTLLAAAAAGSSGIRGADGRGSVHGPNRTRRVVLAVGILVSCSTEPECSALAGQPPQPFQSPGGASPGVIGLDLGRVEDGVQILSHAAPRSGAQGTQPPRLRARRFVSRSGLKPRSSNSATSLLGTHGGHSPALTAAKAPARSNRTPPGLPPVLSLT